MLSTLALVNDCVCRSCQSLSSSRGLDSSLIYDQHLLNTVRNCNFHLCALSHIRSSLTQDVANMMASCIIGSRIDYCNSLLIGISEQNLDRLRVQSKAARIVCNAGRQVTSSDVLYSLHWLPVRRRIELKTATLCFKAVKLGNSPNYLKNMLKPYEPLRSLRSSTMDLLTVLRTDTSFGLRRFSVAGPRIWNGLPHELRQCNTLQCFKSVSLEDILLPPSHGQLAPHSQVAPPIAFLMTKLARAK